MEQVSQSLNFLNLQYPVSSQVESSRVESKTTEHTREMCSIVFSFPDFQRFERFLHLKDMLRLIDFLDFKNLLRSFDYLIEFIINFQENF